MGYVGKGLGARDQVFVGGAIRQGHEQFFDELADRTESGSRRSRSAGCLAAGNHDSSGPEVFLFVDALLVNFGTVKSNGDERVRGLGNNLTFRHRLYDALSGCGRQHAGAQQRQNDADKDDTEAD
ncbi:MAG: hypothetical protein DME98_14485 [Verrucomicrobia bacterium]|nr:MAG: hypothetical protein DME98_14485 [Verrucomicrobiota bacterium]